MIEKECGVPLLESWCRVAADFSGSVLGGGGRRQAVLGEPQQLTLVCTCVWSFGPFFEADFLKY